MRNFNEQVIAALEQPLRTLGESIIYNTSTGLTKRIQAIFDMPEVEKGDGYNRFIGRQPVIQVKSADIINRDRDTATFIVDGVTYRPDEYIDDDDGMITITLRIT